MYNNSNSNFPTVVFVVIVLVGTGCLIYHCMEITTDNRRLMDANQSYQTSVESLTADVSTLKTANEALVSENTTLRTENDRLSNENSTLRSENQRLHSSLGNSDGASSANHEILRSSILPDDPEIWVNIMLVAVTAGFLVFCYIVYLLIKELRPKKAHVASEVHNERSISHKNRPPYVLDSHYYDQ